MRQLFVVLVILIIVALLGALYSVYPAALVTTLQISPAEAKRHRFGLIIDVRNPKERETLGFYPNSIPIPLENIVREVPALIGMGASSKQKHILVYANGDRRAHVAAEMLYDAGFTRVRYIGTTYDKMMPGY